VTYSRADQTKFANLPVPHQLYLIPFVSLSIGAKYPASSHLKKVKWELSPTHSISTVRSTFAHWNGRYPPDVLTQQIRDHRLHTAAVNNVVDRFPEADLRKERLSILVRAYIQKGLSKFVGVVLVLLFIVSHLSWHEGGQSFEVSRMNLSAWFEKADVVRLNHNRWRPILPRGCCRFFGSACLVADCKNASIHHGFQVAEASNRESITNTNLNDNKASKV